MVHRITPAVPRNCPCAAILQSTVPREDFAESGSRSVGIIGEKVRREKSVDFSGCNSTVLQFAPDSCSAGPAMSANCYRQLIGYEKVCTMRSGSYGVFNYASKRATNFRRLRQLLCDSPEHWTHRRNRVG